MMIIKHGFADYKLDPRTETLIVGTFNPGQPWIDVDFFYSSARNYLWVILPTALGEGSLKGTSKYAKIAFCDRNRIGFIDLISEVDVEEGAEINRSDRYLDGRSKWRLIDDDLGKLRSLKRACFTRKTYSGIPRIQQRIQNVASTLRSRGVELRSLISPARYYSAKKQTEWNSFLHN